MYQYLSKQIIQKDKITRIYTAKNILLECSTEYEDNLTGDEKQVTMWDCKFVTPTKTQSLTLNFNDMQKHFLRLRIEANEEPELFCQQIKS